MRTLIIVLAVLGAAAGGFVAHAQHKPGQYTIYGAGSSSCGTWIAEHPRGPQDNSGDLAFSINQWVLGFVSGYGYGDADDLRKTDAAALTAFVDNYCRANPLANIAKAAAALVNELEKL